MRGHPKASRLAACSGKVGFDSYTRANRSIERRSARGRMRTGRGDELRLVPYRCRYCSRWHVGSAPREDAPKRRLRWMPEKEEDECLV